MELKQLKNAWSVPLHQQLTLTYLIIDASRLAINSSKSQWVGDFPPSQLLLIAKKPGHLLAKWNWLIDALSYYALIREMPGESIIPCESISNSSKFALWVDYSKCINY